MSAQHSAAVESSRKPKSAPAGMDAWGVARSVLDALPGYVMLVDDEHHVLMVNQALVAATGRSAEDFVGEYCPKAMHGLDHAFPGCPLEDAVAQGGSVERELRDDRSGGWLASCVYPTDLVSPTGRPVFLHTTRDITELAQGRTQIARELAERTVLHDLLQASVSTPGLDQYLEYFMRRLTSLPWLKVEAKGAIFLVGDEPDVLLMRTQCGMAEALLRDCASVQFGRCLCGRAAQTGKPIHAAGLDGRHETRFDGMPDHGHYCVPLLSGTNQVLGVLNLYLHAGHEQDDKELAFLFAASSLLAGTVERKRAETELTKHRAHLEELVLERTRELNATQERLVLQEKLATVGRVAGSVAHELRNPLGAIRNASFYLQMTAAPKLEGKQLRHLQVIDEYVDRANQAITMILDFTQGRQPEPVPCALQSILQRAVTDASLPPNVEVLIAIPPRLPQVLVDEGQVTVVFRNLLTNAGRAMPGGGTVKIQARAGQNEVVVDVADTGTGVKPEHMARLFQPLFTTGEIGIGLGLAICQGFVRANRGAISVVSELGKGTTFTVTLPTTEGNLAIGRDF